MTWNASLPSSYVRVEGEPLQNLESSARHVLTILKRSLGDAAGYDVRSVKAISDDLDKKRLAYNANEEAKNKIMWLYGAFLGRAMIENAGGQWVDNKVDNYSIRFKTRKGEEVMAAPFTKVAKHLSNGAEDSILAYFMAMDEIVRNGIPGKQPG